MTRIALALLLLAAFGLTAEAKAQAAKNAAYFELGGNAIAPSVNYERRFTESWAGRIGVSFVSSATSTSTSTDSDSALIVPLTVSWIGQPQSNHHLELGGGVTFATGDQQELFDDLGDDEDRFSTAFATAIVGYRYQKPGRGFQFRAAFTPVIDSGGILPWAGISFGYAW
jgi:hypothetical protein